VRRNLHGPSNAIALGALFCDRLSGASQTARTTKAMPFASSCTGPQERTTLTTYRVDQDKYDMEQPSNNALGAIRSGLSKNGSKAHHFACPVTPKSRRGYAEGKNIHDLGKATRFSLLLMSPETVSPQRVMKLTKDMKNACLTPMCGSPRRNLYAGVTPPPLAGATPTSRDSGHCEEVVRDNTKWETLKAHMRNRAKGGFTPMALGENLNDLLESASNHERGGAPPSPRQV